ncbi:tetratricopeptide repeat protein [Alphaproteobacteria bacterium]|jgi:tetratricopeptide (TPR) repeat protein|nr:tetratricopeptide repeat protein [Alphaproteobacteria bacterium]
MDSQDYELSHSNAEADAQIDKAVRAFTLGYGDANAHLSASLEHAPNCAMARLLQLWLRLLSNNSDIIAEVGPQLASICTDGWNDREKGHLEALQLASKRRWPSAVAVLDRLLMLYPHDLAAHQCAMRLDSYLGRFHRSAGRAARALPFWSKEHKNYGIILSFFGFGLEESGDYARAEDIAREAAILEPYGYWPHHTVSHVLEMTGRPTDGIDWMDTRFEFWSSTKNNNCAHIWWHKALFHIDLGQCDEALKIYDENVVPLAQPVGFQLCNLTALLWRLETLGCDAGNRWVHQHKLFQQQSTEVCNPFGEIHAVMAALRADDWTAYETLLSGMQTAANDGSEIAPAYGEVAVPIAKAIAQYVKGVYGNTVDLLLQVRANLSRMGGSVAQRDLIEWTLTAAAIRASERSISVSLANERMAFKPDSLVNQRFMAEAEAISF